MTEMELRDQAVRGERAAEILNSPVVQQALDAIERDIVELWEACPERDKEGKEELWKLYKTAKKFRGVLQGYVEGGKHARRQVELAHPLVRKMRGYL